MQIKYHPNKVIPVDDDVKKKIYTQISHIINNAANILKNELTKKMYDIRGFWLKKQKDYIEVTEIIKSYIQNKITAENNLTQKQYDNLIKTMREKPYKPYKIDENILKQYLDFIGINYPGKTRR